MRKMCLMDSNRITSRNDFLHAILVSFYSMNREQVHDNYDSYRFSSDGIDRSAFDIDWHAKNLALFMQHVDDFYHAYCLLNDRASQELFVKLILYRLLGHIHVRIQEGTSASKERADIFQIESMSVGNSSLKIADMFGGLKQFHGVKFLDRSLNLDCWPGTVYYTFVRKQYFLERSNVVIRPEPDDVIIDGGACFGDNALAFAIAAANGHVHSFEPLPSYRAVCLRNARQNDLDRNISFWPYALSRSTRNLDTLIQNDRGGSPAFSIVNHESELPTISIDDFVTQEDLKKLDFVKMDIEGAELSALEGAAHAIEEFKPKLAISLYHDFSDFFLIPAYLAKHFPFYDFYLDHYSIHAGETVLFAHSRK